VRRAPLRFARLLLASLGNASGVTDLPRLEVGRVTKAHGLKGEVVIDLVSDYPEVRLAPGSRLWTGEQELVVRSSRPFQPLEDPEALWVHRLIGSRVVEQGSGVERGRVVAVVANPAHELLELDSGALVPIVFVQSCEDGVTLITPPEGLFDVES